MSDQQIGWRKWYASGWRYVRREGFRLLPLLLSYMVAVSLFFGWFLLDTVVLQREPIPDSSSHLGLLNSLINSIASDQADSIRIVVYLFFTTLNSFLLLTWQVVTLTTFLLSVRCEPFSNAASLSRVIDVECLFRVIVFSILLMVLGFLPEVFRGMSTVVQPDGPDFLDGLRVCSSCVFMLIFFFLYLALYTYLIFVPALIVDRQMGVIESISRSVQLVHTNFWQLLIMRIILGFVFVFSAIPMVLVLNAIGYSWGEEPVQPLLYGISLINLVYMMLDSATVGSAYFSLISIEEEGG